MVELTSLARRIMTWMLPVAALGGYLALVPLGEARNLATIVVNIARYVVTPPVPDDLPNSIRVLGEIPVNFPVSDLELRLFVNVDESEIQNEWFMTSGRRQPLGHSPKGWHPMFPDRLMRHDFEEAVRRLKVWAEQADRNVRTIGDLDKYVAPPAEVLPTIKLPFSYDRISRTDTILLLSILLLVQMLYLLSVIRTMQTEQCKRSDVNRSWIFFHDGYLAWWLAASWTLGPALLLYFAAVRNAGWFQYSDAQANAAVAVCWALIALSMFVRHLSVDLRRLYELDV